MKKQLLALALMTSAFFSCTDDSYDLDNISNDFRIGVNEYLPIARSSVKLKDMLDEFKTDYIEEDGDGALFFVFDTVTRVDIKPFDISIDPFTFSLEKDIDYTSGVIPKNASYIFEVPIKLGFDGDDAIGRIDSIDVKEGRFVFSLEGNINTSDLAIQVLSDPAHYSGSISNTSDNSIIMYLLNGWIRFPKEGDLVVKVKVTATKDIVVSGSNLKIDLVSEKVDLKYRSIWGSFQSNVSQNNYTDFNINLYDDKIDPHLVIKDPKMTISAKTNSGMPITCTIKGFVGKHKSNKSSGKDSVVAVFKNSSDTLDIMLESSKTSGDTVPAFIEEFNNINGSLDKIFSYLPDSVSVRSAFRVDADTSNNESYFLLESTFIDLNINARIPLHIGAKSYITIKDTIDGVDILKDIEDYQKSDFGVEKAEVILEIENKLPLEAIVDARFCSVDTVAGKPVFTEFTSLHKSVKINAASIIDKRTGSSIPTKNTIKVEESMLNDIKRINAICFTYTIKVPTGVDEDGVLLTSDCSLSAYAYAHVKANITNSKEK